MSAFANKLSLQKQKNLGRDELVNVEKQLVKLEDDIRKLKIEFDIFFVGGSKRPPHESRGRVESQIKRILDDRSLTYAQRYKLNALVSRYTSFRELWRRTFKSRGEEFI